MVGSFLNVLPLLLYISELHEKPRRNNREEVTEKNT